MREQVRNLSSAHLACGKMQTDQNAPPRWMRQRGEDEFIGVRIVHSII